MGLFESVQLELFEFLGIPKERAKAAAPAFLKLPQESSVFPEHWPYEIVRKSYKRGLSFKVTPKGILRVLAPKSLKEDLILKELLRHKDWIELQFQRADQIKDKFPQKKWKSGEKIPFRGKELNLNIQMTTTKRAQVQFSNHEVDFFVPADWQRLSYEEQEKKMAHSFKAAFKERFSLELSAQLGEWSKKTGLNPKELRFRDTKTQWGSCSSLGVICLNWKMGVFRKELSDYIIVHELCHLVHQDHSARFWNLVEEYIPKRKKLMKELDETNYLVDFLSKKSELYELNPSL